MTHLGNNSYEIYIKIGNGVSANSTPVTPELISPPSETRKLEATTFTSSTTDPEGDELYYQFSWGEGTSSWQGPFNSGDTCTVENSWFNEGTFDVSVRTKDIWGATTDWAQIHTITVGCCVGTRGNVDNGADDGTLPGSIDISDLVYLVAFSFQGGPAPICIEEADIDGSGGALPIDIADIVSMVSFMFQGGDSPASCP